ncbi:amidohydrolase [soil metagenome]
MINIFSRNFIALTSLLFFYTSVSAQKKNNSPLPFDKIRQSVYADSARLTSIFIDIHQNPELGFMETRTSAIITKELKTLGYDVISDIGITGLAGIMKNGNGPVVMYRADMDALPVKEATNLHYASTKIGKKYDGTEVPVMHACGHDAHVTWMLGVAKIMASMKSQWKGTLVFIAQPAEEIGRGADSMIGDRMYERGVPIPDFVFGMHTIPLALGSIENVAGSRMAGADFFDITFHGVGGHGSAPQLAKDPIIMAATAILNYQTIVNRSLSPLSPHVLTVGSVIAGTANNVIPPSSLVKLGIRWFTQSDRDLMINGINRVDSSIAFANNLPADLYPTISRKGGAPTVKNDSAMVLKINTALAKIFPDKIIANALPMLASEDFPALIINSKKNAIYDYMFVGTADPVLSLKANNEGKRYPFYWHNPDYVVDIRAIPLGTMIGAISLMEMFRK